MINSEPSLAQRILAGDISGRKDMSLSNFENLYREIQKVSESTKDQLPNVDVLILSEHTIIKFSSANNFIVFIKESRPLAKKDFKILFNRKFYGNIKPIRWDAFVWTEIKKNGIFLIVIYIVLLYLLSFDSQNSNLQIMGQMLVEANALFIGIFVLFTITQNRELLATRNLVREGITHRMMQNDFYITYLSIASLLSAFLTVVLVGTTINIPLWIIRISSIQVEITIARLVGAGSLVLLINCFLSVTQYYLRAMRSAVEGKMFREIMSFTDDNESD